MKTNLKHQKAEATIRGTKVTEAFEFFSTIGQVLDPIPEDNGNMGPLVEWVDDTEDAETDQGSARKVRCTHSVTIGGHLLVCIKQR